MVYYCNWGGQEHLAGDNCNNTYGRLECSSGGGGGSGSGSGGEGGGSGGGGGSGSSGTGSSGSGTSGTTTTTPVITDTAPVVPYRNINLVTILSLNTTQATWINSVTNAAVKRALQEYMYYNPANVSFGVWTIDYLMQNLTVTLTQFQNWFMTPREGQDFSYDQLYWENPGLTFTSQNLPSFQAFDDAYPRINGVQLAQLVGGDVLTLYNQFPSVVRGFCALKVSRALNYSGIVIPNITTTNGNPGTVLGGDGKYYFLNAKALNKWMQKTFGINPTNPNHIRILGSQGGQNGENFPGLISGIRGIYSMVSSNSQWASGHADLIDDGFCVFGCHLYDTPPAPIDFIDIWILN